MQGCCEASNPSTGHLWAGKRPWHLDTCGIWTQGWVLGWVSQVAAPWQLNSPAIMTRQTGDPLPAQELGTALGSVFGVRAGGYGRQLGSGALALTQSLSQACWATLVEFLNASVAKLLPYRSR